MKGHPTICLCGCVFPDRAPGWMHDKRPRERVRIKPDQQWRWRAYHVTQMFGVGTATPITPQCENEVTCNTMAWAHAQATNRRRWEAEAAYQDYVVKKEPFDPNAV